MKTKEKFETLFTFRGFEVELSNIAKRTFEKEFSEFDLSFLCDNVKKVLSLYLKDSQSEDWYGENCIVTIKNTNIKFAMEVRKDYVIVFDIVDGSKHKALTEEEKFSLVEKVCKEQGQDPETAYYRFDPEPGFEDWAFGFSFYDEGKLHDCFETALV